MIELEITLVFLVACFFTLLWVARDFKIFWGIIGFACWITTGMMWLFITPMESHVSIAFLFHTIGIMFLLVVIVQWMHRLDISRGYEEEDEWI